MGVCCIHNNSVEPQNIVDIPNIRKMTIQSNKSNREKKLEKNILENEKKKDDENKNIENKKINDIRAVNNIEDNFKLNTEITCKTTENCSVNIYILNQIEEILLYSIIMDVTTNVKPKKEEKGNNNETLEELNNKIVFNNIAREKEQKLFD